MSSRPHLARSVSSSCLLVRFRFSARLRAHFSPLMAVVLVDLPSVSSYPQSNLGGEAARNCGSSVWRRKCIWSYSLLLSSLFLPCVPQYSRTRCNISPVSPSRCRRLLLHTRHRGAVHLEALVALRSHTFSGGRCRRGHGARGGPHPPSTLLALVEGGSAWCASCGLRPRCH